MCVSELKWERTGYTFVLHGVAAGQVGLPAVRFTVTCSLFACRLYTFEAFLFLPVPLRLVFSNPYTKTEHPLVFFCSW